MNSLKNKVAMITGSEGDIGKALVNVFHKQKAIVYGFDIKSGDDITIRGIGSAYRICHYLSKGVVLASKG